MNNRTSLAKITKPTSDKVLIRDRLFTLLGDVTKPIIWITAPPGAGKTTLISYSKEKNLTFFGIKLILMMAILPYRLLFF